MSQHFRRFSRSAHSCFFKQIERGLASTARINLRQWRCFFININLPKLKSQKSPRSDLQETRNEGD